MKIKTLFLAMTCLVLSMSLVSCDKDKAKEKPQAKINEINVIKLKRDKRKVRWTEAFHITRKKAQEREKAAKDTTKEKSLGPVTIKRTKKRK